MCGWFSSRLGPVAPTVAVDRLSAALARALISQPRCCYLTSIEPLDLKP
jgi:hypothetical protein